MVSQPTVCVERIEGHHALRLNWCRWVIERDIRPAFHELTAFLDRASRPLHVVVDLQSDPRLPLPTTISETLSGPFMHPMMGEWIVIGSNQRAQVVASVITAVGLRNNIHWTTSETEALAHLDALEEQEEARLVPAFDGFGPPDAASQ